MFLARRPSADLIDRFLRESQDLPLSYGPVGIVGTGEDGWTFDETTGVIGRGQPDFERARAALLTWTQFDLGWVETLPRHAPVGVGTVVAVLIRHVGFWSLNGARVVYEVGSRTEGSRFGFAYGTLTNHAEAGEELFEVFIDPATGDVVYRLRAASRPRAALARLGKPIVRTLQARFRRDSLAAMTRVTAMTKRLQTYETPDITVTFDPNVCTHSGVCVRGLSAVFDVREQRWVRPENAPAADVAAQVARCPSGALQYQLKKPDAPA